MSSPVLWGPNGTASNLQSQILQSNGSLLQNNGPRNYINYNNFENQATTGWSLGTTGTLTNGIPTGTPTFGSGAAGTLSLAASTSSPIAGTASLSLVSSAATTAGNMFASDLLPIDTADQAKVLTYTFYYTVPTGVTNANFSGTSSNSYGIACYDVTNSSWLPVVGNFAMTQSTGVGIATGTMQTNITTANVRFIVYCVNATAGAVTVNFDRFYLGPQTAPIGPVVTDMTAFTGTFSAGFGVVTTNNVKQNRVGDCLILSGTFDTNVVAASAPIINLPYTIDTSKINSTAFKHSFGRAWRQIGTGTSTSLTSGAGADIEYALTYNGTSNQIQLVRSTGSATAGGTFVNEITTNMMGNATTIVLEDVVIPIAGWSSQVQMSSDTDTRVICMTAGMTTSQAVASTAVIKYDTVVTDRAGSYSTSTGMFTAPVTGSYRISVVGYASAPCSLYFQVSGVTKAYLTQLTSANVAYSGTVTWPLVAGQTVGVYSDSAATFVGSSGFVNSLSIERLSGPAVIAATETIACRYSSAAGNAMASTATLMALATKSYDTHAAYSAGVFTAPATGFYSVSAFMTLGSAALTTGQQFRLFLYKNGSPYSTLANFYGNGATIAPSAGGTDDIYCLAGETISIYGSNAASAALLGAADYNYIDIKKIK